MHMHKIVKIFLLSLLPELMLASYAPVASSSNTINQPVFNIVSKIYIDGKLITTPHIIARANQQATIDLSDDQNASQLRIKLTANDVPKNLSGNEAIKIDFDVRYKNAKENLNVKPKIIVLPKQKDMITLTTNSGHTFKIWVVAKREMS